MAEAETLEKESDQTIDMGLAGFKVYPNPTTGQFTLEFDQKSGLQDCIIQIFSMTGARVVAEEFKSIQWCKFDFASQPRGIYIIQVVRGDRVDTVKITKQ
jgi:hypothetical protein